MIKHPAAFTLIELLIVVAIIAILAAIAVPNFLEAQIRAKVSRTKADMRTVATAIESYAVEYTKYPLRHDKWQILNPVPGPAFAPDFVEKIYAPSAPTAAVGMKLLTTPIAYITSLPKDVFNQPAQGITTPGASDALDYWDPIQTDSWLSAFTGTFRPGKGKGWMLISVGPDRYLGNAISGNPGGYPANNADIYLVNTWRHIYDPTNGSVSYGNIYRFQGDLTEAEINSP